MAPKLKKAKSDPLRVLVRHIREDGERVELVLDVGECQRLLGEPGDSETGYQPTGDGLRGELRLSRTSEMVFVRGRFALAMAVTCCRCLVESQTVLDVGINWSFLPAAKYRSQAASPAEVELTADDLDTSFYEGESIDLREVLREAVLLELDPFPTCSGGECDATDTRPPAEGAGPKGDDIDPRWLPLIDLKRRS